LGLDLEKLEYDRESNAEKAVSKPYATHQEKWHTL